jgi:hypothetical protein
LKPLVKCDVFLRGIIEIADEYVVTNITDFVAGNGLCAEPTRGGQSCVRETRSYVYVVGVKD